MKRIETLLNECDSMDFTRIQKIYLHKLKDAIIDYYTAERKREVKAAYDRGWNNGIDYINSEEYNPNCMNVGSDLLPECKECKAPRNTCGQYNQISGPNPFDRK